MDGRRRHPGRRHQRRRWERSGQHNIGRQRQRTIAHIPHCHTVRRAEHRHGGWHHHDDRGLFGQLVHKRTATCLRVARLNGNGAAALAAFAAVTLAVLAAAFSTAAAFTFAVFATCAGLVALLAFAATFSILAATFRFSAFRIFAAFTRFTTIVGRATVLRCAARVGDVASIARVPRARFLRPHDVAHQGHKRREDRGLPVSHQHEFNLSRNDFFYLAALFGRIRDGPRDLARAGQARACNNRPAFCQRRRSSRNETSRKRKRRIKS